MNIGIAWHRMNNGVASFKGFVIAGNPSTKTDTDQYIITAASIISASLNIKVAPFRNEPYFTGSAPTTTGVTGVAYDNTNNIFMMVSRDTVETPYSANGGTTWRTISAPAFGIINEVKYGAVTGSAVPGFLIYGDWTTPTIRYLTSSAISGGWQTATTPSMISILGAATNGTGRWVATGQRDTGTNSDILWSTDGVTFNDILVASPTFTTGGRSAIYGEWTDGVGGHAPAWIAYGYDVNPIKYTFAIDGSSGWTNSSFSLVSTIESMATNGAGTWVAVGDASGTMAFSVDYGATWESFDLVSAHSLNPVSISYGIVSGVGVWMVTGTTLTPGGYTIVWTSETFVVGVPPTWSQPTFVSPAEDFINSPNSERQTIIYCP